MIHLKLREVEAGCQKQIKKIVEKNWVSPRPIAAKREGGGSEVQEELSG